MAAKPKSQLSAHERYVRILRSRLKLQPSYECRRLYYDAISEHRYLWIDLITVAQIRHRYNLGDPQEPMKEAVSLAGTLAELWDRGSKLMDDHCPSKPLTDQGYPWAQLPKRVDVVGFRFGLAALLSLLVYDEMSPAILKVVPRVSQWNAEEFFIAQNFPDAGLVEMLQLGRRPRGWKNLLQAFTDRYGSTLYQETMDCYANIILASQAGEWAEGVKFVRHAHELFERRADADYEEFTPEEGPGSGNQLSIDLRLSALMRTCFRKKPKLLDDMNSIHRWKS